MVRQLCRVVLEASHVKPIFQAIAAKVEDGLPVATGLVKTALVILSKWFTTASNMVICN